MALWNLLPAAWQVALQTVESQIGNIEKELDSLTAQGTEITPTKTKIFAALPESPDLVRVIVVGQDPYPTLGHATGLAFSVPANTKPLPPTLRNILGELHEDLSDSTTASGDLSSWQNQGVLLLNRVLTTKVGTSLAHQDLGWQEITLEIVRAVRTANPEVVGVLWGKHAQTLAGEFDPSRTVLSAHPSPLSAYRGFFGSKPFSKVNELLVASGHTVVNW